MMLSYWITYHSIAVYYYSYYNLYSMETYVTDRTHVWNFLLWIWPFKSDLLLQVSNICTDQHKFHKAKLHSTVRHQQKGSYLFVPHFSSFRDLSDIFHIFDFFNYDLWMLYLNHFLSIKKNNIYILLSFVDWVHNFF